MSSKIISVLLLAAVSTHANAGALRSVDKDGNITFSDEPVPGSVESERIIIDAPAPSRGSVNESQREAQAVTDKANSSQQKMDAASQRGTQKSQLAEQDIEYARKQLEVSKTIGEGDRQGKAGGGTRLTPEYHERVKTAEENLERAKSSAR